jgi:uncharacterized protein (TIGR03435 family)
VTLRMYFVGMIALALTLVPIQSTNGQSKPAFDVVSVKPVLPGANGRFESHCDRGGRFISVGTPLIWSIEWAYGLDDYQVSEGWPGWLNSYDTYDIEAETDGPITETDCRKMVQALFEERFGLRMHSQSKIVPVYELIPAKKGPRFSAADRVTINGVVKQSTSERNAPPGWTMARLANYLASLRGVERPVIDRTLLDGVYGFALNYSTRDGDGRPDIFTALPEQLGLRLKAARETIQVWTIDHVEKPSAN